MTRQEEKYVTELQEKLSDLMVEKSNLEQDNVLLRERLTEIEKEYNETKAVVKVELLDEDIKKIILKNYARNKSSLSIYRDVGKIYGVSIEEIEEIVKNIDKLDSELIEYYKKEVEYFRGNDLVKFLSEQDILKDSIDFTLSIIDNQILEFSKQKIMDKDDWKIYNDLMARKKDFLNMRLKTVDTYKEGTSLTNNNKENSNNISIEIKKQVNNVMNINTFKDMGVKTSVIEIDEEVKKWE